MNQTTPITIVPGADGITPDQLLTILLTPEPADLHPGEYVYARLAAGDTEGAELTAFCQYGEGFCAALDDAPYADFRPVNWQRGWCDGYALAELGPMFAARAL